MKVTIKVHDDFRPLYRRWVRSLSPNPLDAQLFAETYFQNLRDRLIASGGLPPGGIRDDRDGLASYWVELGGGAWVQCVVTGQTRRLLWVRTRTVELIGLGPLPPPPPASPPENRPS